MKRISWFVHIALLSALAASLVLITGCGAAARDKPATQAELTREQLETLDWLDRTAQQLYRFTSEQEPAKALEQLLALETGVKRLRFEGITSVDGMQALTTVMTEAKEAFTVVRYDPDHAQQHAAQVRLAVDALTHKQNPMWLQYYKLLHHDVQRLRSAVASKQTAALQQAIQETSQHLAVIKPSIRISRGVEHAVKFDSLLASLRQLSGRQPPSWEELNTVSEHLSQNIDQLFGRKSDKETIAPPMIPGNPYLHIAMIASFILTILSYVGYLRYKAEQDYRKVKRG